MKRFFKIICMFLFLTIVGSPIYVYANDLIAKTTIGIVFTLQESVPNPNQKILLNNARGQPNLPKTNDMAQPLLFWLGILIIFLMVILYLYKKERRIKIMHKLLLTGTLILGASIGLASLTQSVSAADNSAKTTADVTFTGGGLNISQAPTAITFGTHTLDSKEQTYTEVSDGKPSDSSLTVGDYRGQLADGWTLTAKLETADFSGMDISLNPKGATGTTDYAVFTSQKLNGDSQTISKVAAENMSKEKPDTPFTLGASIHIPTNTPLEAKAYSNKIIWNLETTPKS